MYKNVSHTSHTTTNSGSHRPPERSGSRARRPYAGAQQAQTSTDPRGNIDKNSRHSSYSMSGAQLSQSKFTTQPSVEENPKFEAHRNKRHIGLDSSQAPRTHGPSLDDVMANMYGYEKDYIENMVSLNFKSAITKLRDKGAYATGKSIKEVDIQTEVLKWSDSKWKKVNSAVQKHLEDKICEMVGASSLDDYKHVEKSGGPSLEALLHNYPSYIQEYIYKIRDIYVPGAVSQITYGGKDGAKSYIDNIKIDLEQYNANAAPFVLNAIKNLAKKAVCKELGIDSLDEKPTSAPATSTGKASDGTIPTAKHESKHTQGSAGKHKHISLQQLLDDLSKMDKEDAEAQIDMLAKRVKKKLSEGDMSKAKKTIKDINLGFGDALDKAVKKHLKDKFQHELSVDKTKTSGSKVHAYTVDEDVIEVIEETDVKAAKKPHKSKPQHETSSTKPAADESKVHTYSVADDVIEVVEESGFDLKSELDQLISRLPDYNQKYVKNLVSITMEYSIDEATLKNKKEIKKKIDSFRLDTNGLSYLEKPIIKLLHKAHEQKLEELKQQDKAAGKTSYTSGSNNASAVNTAEANDSDSDFDLDSEIEDLASGVTETSVDYIKAVAEIAIKYALLAFERAGEGAAKESINTFTLAFADIKHLEYPIKKLLEKELAIQTAKMQPSEKSQSKSEVSSSQNLSSQSKLDDVLSGLASYNQDYVKNMMAIYLKTVMSAYEIYGAKKAEKEIAGIYLSGMGSDVNEAVKQAIKEKVEQKNKLSELKSLVDQVKKSSSGKSFFKQFVASSKKPETADKKNVYIVPFEVTGTVWSGHGGLEDENDYFTVPKGTSWQFFTYHGAPLGDGLGGMVESKQELPAGMVRRIYNEGDRMPNYTLYPPSGLNIQGNPIAIDPYDIPYQVYPNYPRPITVTSKVKLKDFTTENMGMNNFAACSSEYGHEKYGNTHVSYGILERQRLQAKLNANQ